MRELVIKRLTELANNEHDGKLAIIDSNNVMIYVDDLNLASDKDLLSLLEDLVGFNG
jgi:hypothetical protein